MQGLLAAHAGVVWSGWCQRQCSHSVQLHLHSTGNYSPHWPWASSRSGALKCIAGPSCSQWPMFSSAAAQENEFTPAWPSRGICLHLCLLCRLHCLLQSHWQLLACITLLLLGMVLSQCQHMTAPCLAPCCTQLLKVLMALCMHAVDCCQLQVSLCSYLQSKASAVVMGHTLVAVRLVCVRPCTRCQHKPSAHVPGLPAAACSPAHTAPAE